MPTYKAIFRSDELYHFNKNHDRLGRFDTGDGDGDGQTEYRDRLARNTKSFNEMSRKEKKRYIKDRRLLNNEIINKSIELGNKYGETEKGKKMYKKFSDSYDKYFDPNNIDAEIDDWNDPKVKKIREQFIKDEKAYLMDEGRFVAKKLIDEYGTKNVSELSYGWVAPLKSMEGKSTVTLTYDGTVDDLIEKYAEQAWYAHRV